jgi:hypothetical protein
MKEASEEGMDADDVEVITAGCVEPDGDGRAIGVERCCRHLVQRQAGEGAVVIAQVDVVGVGSGRIAASTVDLIEVCTVRDVERAEDEQIEQSEDERVGTDAESERDKRDEGEAG